MSELDKKLDNILTEVRTDFDYNYDSQKVAEEGNAPFIEQIKQAFQECGYVLPENTPPTPR